MQRRHLPSNRDTKVMKMRMMMKMKMRSDENENEKRPVFGKTSVSAIGNMDK